MTVLQEQQGVRRPKIIAAGSDSSSIAMYFQNEVEAEKGKLSMGLRMKCGSMNTLLGYLRLLLKLLLYRVATYPIEHLLDAYI